MQFSQFPFDGTYQNLQMSPVKKLALAFTFSEILQYKNFDLKKVGQAQGVQFCHLNRWMENVKIYKCLLRSFALALTVSDIDNFFIFYLRK